MIPKRIRVESDGSKQGTRIFDADTNEDVSNRVTSVEFSHDAGSVPRLRIELIYHGPAVEVRLTASVPPPELLDVVIQNGVSVETQE